MPRPGFHSESEPHWRPQGEAGHRYRATRDGSNGVMSTTAIRLHEPRELLAFLPYQLGFRPTESLVAISLRGRRSEVGLVARVDLDDLGEEHGGPGLARSLVGHLDADHASAYALVVYSAGGLGAPTPAADRATKAVEHLRVAAEAHLPERGAWVVAETGYSALGCADTRCCPPGGRPLSELESTAIGAHMVLAGVAVADSRECLGRIAPAGAAARRSASRAARRWAAKLEAAERGEPRGGAATSASAWRRSSLEAWREEWEQGRAGYPSRAVGYGRLAAALQDVRTRDAVLLSLIPGTGDLAERSLLEDADAEVGAALARMMDPRTGVAPRRDELETARRLLEGIVGHAPRRLGAPALTLLAMLAWWEGDGARAGVLLARTEKLAPGYRLAALLQQALDVGMPPGWIRRGR